MKKITAILCALLIACLAGSAFAEDVPVSSLYRPVLPETFKTLVAGKTFEAEVVRKECYGEDEDAFWMISVTAAEETRFAAEDVENMKVNDIVAFAPGRAVMIMEKTADEFGFCVKDGSSDEYLFTVMIPLDKDISFLDWSDPENLEAPLKKGYDELLDLLLADTNFSPYNTKVTFDADGKLVEFLYTYSPWN